MPFGIRVVFQLRKLSSISGLIALPHLDLNSTNVIDNNSLDDESNERSQILQLYNVQF